jgi:hypothetical protein
MPLPRSQEDRHTGLHPVAGIDPRSRTEQAVSSPEYRHVAIHRLVQSRPRVSSSRA